MDDYKSLGRKKVYEGQKVTVSIEKLELPNGNIVEWDLIEFPDIDMGIPLTDHGTVLMGQEWRQGPHGIITEFVGARKLVDEELFDLKKELKEELGLINGKFKSLVRFSNGVRITGFREVYLITDFEITKTEKEENEIIKTIELPVEGLYDALSKDHVVTAETLLMAKLVDDFAKAM